MKKALKILGIVIALLLVVVLGYVSYVFFSYSRIEDMQHITEIDAKSVSAGAEFIEKGKPYTAISYNIGFGAYLPEFSFFMDGGVSSWAKDEESVRYAVENAAKLAKSFNPDFALFQEVDLDSTRSYHVNQANILASTLEDMDMAFAVNYDSAFLMYPLHQPHGKSKSGLAFLSKYDIGGTTVRRSLPISESFSKFLDLDRCYTYSRFGVENGASSDGVKKELVIFHVHMSAYGNSAEVRQGQVDMLMNDMRAEYEKGNYVICGGDFNHDMVSSEAEGEVATWAHPFPRKDLPEGFSLALDLHRAEKGDIAWNTTRNADIPYDAEKSFTLSVDGFIISNNIELIDYQHVNTGYSYSDHDPVLMSFMLKK